MENGLPTKDFFDFNLYGVPDVDLQRIVGNRDARVGVLATTIGSDAERTMLDKMLQAIKLGGLADVALLEVGADERASLAEILHTLNKTSCWLVFGRGARSLGWQFDVPLYQRINLQAHTFVFADALVVLQSDTVKKKQLWAVLQSIFL